MSGEISAVDGTSVALLRLLAAEASQRNCRKGTTDDLPHRLIRAAGARADDHDRIAVGRGRCARVCWKMRRNILDSPAGETRIHVRGLMHNGGYPNSKPAALCDHGDTPDPTLPFDNVTTLRSIDNNGGH